MGRHADWRSWWKSLALIDRKRVHAWLSNHPPPPEWMEGKIAYAFTEMPFAPRGSR